MYGICLLACLGILAVSCQHLLLEPGSPQAVRLPVGLPWTGAHFRIDALAAFFLVVVNLGGAGASLFAIGYGRHEVAPGRVLPFYPLFLAGMNLVVLADDAFSFLVAWEFMSLSSWALVVAHHRDPDNTRAGYIYILMAGFGTLALLLAFGLLAGGTGGYTFAEMRAGGGDAPGRRPDPCPAGRRLQGRARAAARVAAAGASGGAQPRLRPDERGDDEGRGLRLHPHRVRPQRPARVVVERAGDRAWPASPAFWACSAP